ncbi:MAG: hypothetical protein R2865_12025 [Deinococcales bacterium]
MFTSIFKTSMSSYLILSLLLLNSPISLSLAQSDLNPEARSLAKQAAEERLDKMMTTLNDLRQSLDELSFDVESLAFELAFEEPEAIAEYLQEHIAFEPYLGMLRGAKGTLISQAGNATDQAVLLAELLSAAGYEVRYGHAELSEVQTEQLLAKDKPTKRRPFRGLRSF